MGEINVHHDNGNSERRLGQYTIMMIARWFGNITALGDVPCDIGGVSRIRVVGSHLSIYAHTPQGNDNGIGDGAQ